MSRKLLLGLSLLAIAACTPKASNNTAATSGSRIINGTEVQESDSIYKHLVSVYAENEDGSVGICTGTLIGPNTVLTAAHCISTKTSNLRVVFGLNIDEILYAREPDIKDLYLHTVSDVKVHPQWNFEKNQEKASDWHDLAVLRFRGAYPEEFTPAEFLQENDLGILQPGVMAYVAGYGVNQASSREVAKDEVVGFDEETLCDDKGCIALKFSGDGTLRWTMAPISTVENTELRLDEKLSGTCGGDSGGPAFVVVDGKFLFFGVTSRGSLFCNEVGVYTIALKLKDWLGPAIQSLK
ncbi:trypsin-like serine protease [Bdellovibrio sp. ZAP7]|uniref:S1 family peptidase n=1 Tax=Bdellovibrio sp. ZAP7 TaxID=2231053 RepID=UPI00143DFDA5|nr:trypsin-like serine protease [Bdellovibrio sp. ZAP7]